MSSEKPHHHGNLRNALVDAGLTLLSRDGRAGLTLRKAAALAGVSHAAPAHHFDGLDGLLQAIAARGFTTFVALMREERAKMPTDPDAQLLGICNGYLRFATEHQPLFNLIFSEPIRDGDDPDLGAASAEAFEVLSETCDLFEPDPAGPLVNEIKVWSTVHGYAILRQFNRLDEGPGGRGMPLDLILPKLTPKRPV